MIEAGKSTVHVISTEKHAEYQFEFWAMQHLDTAFSQILSMIWFHAKKQKCASALFILSLSAWKQWKLKHLSCPAFRTESTSLDLSPFMGRFFLSSLRTLQADTDCQRRVGLGWNWTQASAVRTLCARFTWWATETLRRVHLYIPGNHLRGELRLLFDDGGAEGVALSDPVRLHSPEHKLEWPQYAERYCCWQSKDRKNMQLFLFWFILS